MKEAYGIEVPVNFDVSVYKYDSRTAHITFPISANLIDAKLQQVTGASGEWCDRNNVCEPEASWTAFLTQLKERGLHGIQYVSLDSHEGLRRAIEKMFTTTLWQRCAVHFLRKASRHATQKTDAGRIHDLKGI